MPGIIDSGAVGSQLGTHEILNSKCNKNIFGFTVTSLVMELCFFDRRRDYRKGFLVKAYINIDKNSN